MNVKNILFSIILFTIFLATSILAIFTAKKITTTHTHSTDKPDFFINNALYTKFNRRGHINNLFRAKKITHFVTNNIYLFEKPNIVIYNKNEKPWHITANKGKSRKGKTKVYLNGNVKIVRKSGINNTGLDVVTNALTVQPDLKFAKTKLPITIVQKGNITKAVGAELNLKTGVLKLLSKIKALYQIN